MHFIRLLKSCIGYLDQRIYERTNLNVHFSITIACKDFKLCLHSLHIHSEGTVSQSYVKKGKHFLTFLNNIFEATKNIN